MSFFGEEGDLYFPKVTYGSPLRFACFLIKLHRLNHCNEVKCSVTRMYIDSLHHYVYVV